VDSISPNAAIAEAARAVALRRLGAIRTPVAVTIYLDEQLEVERVSVELVAVNGVPAAGTPPDRPGRRAKGGGHDIRQFLRSGPQFYSDILKAMRDRGHSESVTREHLKALKALGLVIHANKADPYTLTPDEDEP
jgi:hypothetical protein